MSRQTQQLVEALFVTAPKKLASLVESNILVISRYREMSRVR